MNSTEREFYNDIQDAVSDWDCSFDKYHNDGYFSVEVTVKDEDVDWGDVWNALEEVAYDWRAGIDQSAQEFYLSLKMND